MGDQSRPPLKSGSPFTSFFKPLLDSPEIITEESYIQTDHGVQLELVCIVHASPRVTVEWYKDGQRLEDEPGLNSGSSLLPDRVSIGQSGRKHLMVISRVAEADRGRYTCRAVNELGESKGNIQVMGELVHCLSIVI